MHGVRCGDSAPEREGAIFKERMQHSFSPRVMELQVSLVRTSRDWDFIVNLRFGELRMEEYLSVDLGVSKTSSSFLNSAFITW